MLCFQRLIFHVIKNRSVEIKHFSKVFTTCSVVSLNIWEKYFLVRRDWIFWRRFTRVYEEWLFYKRFPSVWRLKISENLSWVCEDWIFQKLVWSLRISTKKPFHKSIVGKLKSHKSVSRVWTMVWREWVLFKIFPGCGLGWKKCWRILFWIVSKAK